MIDTRTSKEDGYIGPVFIAWRSYSSGFRPGQFAKTIGICNFKPKDQEARPCYIVEYIDGTVDQIPISEYNNLEFKTYEPKEPPNET